MRAGRLIRAARELAAALGEGSGLAGGLAVAAWGEIRATRDVDFVTLLPLESVERALSERGIAYEARRGDIGAGDLPWVVSGELEGARFQVFAPRGGKPFTTVSVRPSGTDGPPIPVVVLPDLIRLKLEAGGSKDLWDVARLIRRYPDEQEPAKQVALSLGLEGDLSLWLERAAR